jgi:hypothetical protein
LLGLVVSVRFPCKTWKCNININVCSIQVLMYASEMRGVTDMALGEYYLTSELHFVFHNELLIRKLNSINGTLHITI